MSVQVRWFPTLAKRTRSGELNTSVDWSQGLTPLAVFKAEGFTDTDADALLILVNGERVHSDQGLQDGDEIEFLVNIQGG